jgi:hypothetical protein
MKHEQKSKYAKSGNIPVYIQKHIPQKWTIKTILKQVELVKSFSSFASIAINLLSIGTHTNWRWKYRNTSQCLSKLKIVPSEECRTIIFSFKCFWCPHVQRLWRKDDKWPSFSANMHVKGRVSPAAIMQCYHIHVSVICISSAVRCIETPWNQHMALTYVMQCICSVRASFITRWFH